MNIKKAYYYLFYKLYKFWETVSVPKFWSDWKAGLSLDILIGFFLFPLLTYYTIYIDRYFKLPRMFIIGILYISLVALPNYFIFHHKDQWKSYVEEFDKWSKKKNRIGGIIVWGIILLIIANLIFSFYLMSQVDWKQYR